MPGVAKDPSVEWPGSEQRVREPLSRAGDKDSEHVAGGRSERGLCGQHAGQLSRQMAAGRKQMDFLWC